MGRNIIAEAVPELTRRLFRADVEQLGVELQSVGAEAVLGVARRFRGGVRELVEDAEACLTLLRQSTQQRAELGLRLESLKEGLAASESAAEERDLSLDFLALISSPERLRGDRKAFGRHFGLDAVNERYVRERERLARQEELLLTTIAASLARVAKNLVRQARALDATDPGQPKGHKIKAAVDATLDLLGTLKLEAVFLDQVRSSPRPHNRSRALDAMRQIARSLPAEDRGRLLTPEAMNVVIRTCFDQDESVWAQREALSLLATLAPYDAVSVCTKRILRHETAPPEDIFVRSHAVGLLRDLATERERLEILERVIRGRDPSELVRMEVVRVLATGASIESDRVLLTLLRGGPSDRDPSPRVRAEAALQVRIKANRGPQHEEIAARALAWVIRNDPDILTRRVAMEEAEQLAKDRQEKQRRYRVDETDHLLLEALDEVVRRDPDVRLKRIATEIRESIVVRTLAAYDWVETRIKRPLSEIDEYSTLRVPAREVAVPEALLGRILAHFTRRDFGVTLERTRTAYLLRKGDRFRRKLWRVLHEMRNPDAAKRSAHQHTQGRSLRGHLRVPPGQLAELVETKVPGERLYLPHEQSWRRFLPTVDDYMSTFSWLPWRREHVVRVFSSEGVTEIRDPRSWFRAAKDHLRMSWAYKELVQLRNREGKREGERARYVAELRYQYGLLTSFAPAAYQFAGKTYPLWDPTLKEHFKSAVTLTVEGEVDPFDPNTAAVSAPLDADFGPFDEDVRDPEATEDGEGEGAESDHPGEGVDELLRPLQPAGVLDRPSPEGPADLDMSNENLFSGSFASGAETDLLGIGPDVKPNESDNDRTGSFGSPPLRVKMADGGGAPKGPDPDETLVGATPPGWGDETSELTASVAVWRPPDGGGRQPTHDMQSDKTGAMDLTASEASIDQQLAETSEESRSNQAQPTTEDMAETADDPRSASSSLTETADDPRSVSSSLTETADEPLQ